MSCVISYWLIVTKLYLRIDATIAIWSPAKSRLDYFLPSFFHHHACAPDLCTALRNGSLTWISLLLAAVRSPQMRPAVVQREGRHHMWDMLAGDSFPNFLIVTNYSQQNYMKRSRWVYFSTFHFIIQFSFSFQLSGSCRFQSTVLNDRTWLLADLLFLLLMPQLLTPNYTAPLKLFRNGRHLINFRCHSMPLYLIDGHLFLDPKADHTRSPNK